MIRRCFIALSLATAATGCATLPTVNQTYVERVHSMVELDELGEKRGRVGWHIISVHQQGGGFSFIVVMERVTPRWNRALMKSRAIDEPMTEPPS